MFRKKRYVHPFISRKPVRTPLTYIQIDQICRIELGIFAVALCEEGVDRNGSAQRKKHRKRQPQDGADPAPLPSGFARCAQAGARHRHAGQASGVQHQIRRVDQPVHAQPFCARKMAEQDAVKKAERLQRQIAAGEHPGRI